MTVFGAIGGMSSLLISILGTAAGLYAFAAKRLCPSCHLEGEEDTSIEDHTEGAVEVTLQVQDHASSLGLQGGP